MGKGGANLKKDEIEKKIRGIIADVFKEEIGKDISEKDQKVYLVCGSPIHTIILRRIGTAIKNKNFIDDAKNITEIEQLSELAWKSYNYKPAYH